MSRILIERIRKDLEKYYQVLDIKRSPVTNGADELVADIIRIYNDSTYTIRKPRFSQIGRPKKIIHEKPLIFAACHGKALTHIRLLKQKKIPVTCIFATDETAWHMEVEGACLKNDFFVPRSHLRRNLLTVIEQNRLIPGTMGTEMINAVKACTEETRRSRDVRSLDDLVMALAMPVWYYENLLAIRPRSP